MIKHKGNIKRKKIYKINFQTSISFMYIKFYEY